MAHDVFISHSSKDKTVADATCAWLEGRGIRCWVAPRDIRPGATWGSSIINAIRNARVMILIFSSHANSSPQIKREVERAIHFGVAVIPMRIEDVLPEGDLEYFLGMPHWLDAFSPPLESHLDALAKAVNEILEIPAAAPRAEAPGNIPERVAELVQPGSLKNEPTRPAKADAPASRFESPPPRSRQRLLIFWMSTAAVAILALGWLIYPHLVSSTLANRQAAAQTKVEAAAEKLSGESFGNILGMVFVPAGTDGVLFGIWDTRVKDYAAFVKETGRNWRKPAFAQTDSDPAVNVSWDDAKAFCLWLTKKEQAAGTLKSNHEYRLPTDAEWSRAVGLNESSEGTPAEKSGKIGGAYPWGTQWPPPSGAGNYAGEESGVSTNIKGYRDGYPCTSPVGSFAANEYGLYDMGGNVSQWCEDKFDNEHDWRVIRGSKWSSDGPEESLSSYRNANVPSAALDENGFRVVVVVSP